MNQFSYPIDIVPGQFATSPAAPPGSHDAKSPPLDALYPERDRFITVDPARYYSREYMAKEWDKLWTRSWTCAGRASDIPLVGSWFSYRLGGESFIVVRSSETEIRAFYNVCRHRGNELVRGDFGRRLKFTCSFHGWQWSANGDLALVTDRSTFRPQALDADLNLRRVRCEQWAGFVFITMDDAAPALLDFLGDIPAIMESYAMDQMHVVKDVVVEFDANWKVTLEAFLESYHLQVTHAQATPFVDDVAYQIDYYPNGHARLQTAIGIPSPREQDRDSLHPGLAFMLSEAGLDPAAFVGRAMDVRAAIAQAKREPDNAWGLDYSGFSDSQLTDDWNYSIFPNMTFNSHPEGVLIMRFLPHPSDPEKSFYHVLVISRALRDGIRLPAYIGVEPDVDISGATRPARRYNTKAKPELGEVLEQDISNIEGVQRGLRSRGFDFCKYSEQESRIVQFYAELERYFAR